MLTGADKEFVGLRQYIIPAVFIMATLIVGGLLMLRGIRSFHYGILDEQSTNMHLITQTELPKRHRLLPQLMNYWRKNCLPLAE